MSEKNDTELLIATNNHVVEGATSLSVGFIDESSVSGEVKGTDAANDLAVVAVKLSDISDGTRSRFRSRQWEIPMSCNWASR